MSAAERAKLEEKEEKRRLKRRQKKGIMVMRA